MSRFNTKNIVSGPNTVNLSGGKAYTMGTEKEIVSILLTSFMNDKYYEKADDTAVRLTQLITTLQSEDQLKTVAKALIYARTVFGMRSITHVGVAAIAPMISGYTWGKDFYFKVVRRPDDVTEILSLMGPFKKTSGKSIPNAMKKGFAKVLESLQPYVLAKYQGKDKAFKMVDAVNLIRPKNTQALSWLISGSLKNEDTWEAQLSAAGNDADKKAKVWLDLIVDKKIGYLALLRNLRNIYEQAPYALPYAVESLTSEGFIRKSLMLPFQFIKAFDEIGKLPVTAETRILQTAIMKAIDISLSNVPKFYGSTVIVLDVSSSMKDEHPVKVGNKTVTPATPAQIGTLFAAVLAKANNADIVTFDATARYINPYLGDSTITVARNIRIDGGATNFADIFPTFTKKYDRVIILSDMQGYTVSGYWNGAGAQFKQSIGMYRRNFNADPFIYSFDLAGYGTLQVHESKTFLLAGFSDKVFDILGLLEKDPDALLNEIKKIDL